MCPLSGTCCIPWGSFYPCRLPLGKKIFIPLPQDKLLLTAGSTASAICWLKSQVGGSRQGKGRGYWQSCCQQCWPLPSLNTHPLPTVDFSRGCWRAAVVLLAAVARLHQYAVWWQVKQYYLIWALWKVPHLSNHANSYNPLAPNSWSLFAAAAAAVVALFREL